MMVGNKSLLCPDDKIKKPFIAEAQFKVATEWIIHICVFLPTFSDFFSSFLLIHNVFSL